jgi:hypothetical protein
MPQSKTQKRQGEINRLNQKRAELQKILDHYLEVPEQIRSTEARWRIASQSDEIGRVDREIARFQAILAAGNSKERKKHQPLVI